MILLLGTLITLSAILPTPFPSLPPPNNICKAGAVFFSTLIELPCNPMCANPC